VSGDAVEETKLIDAKFEGQAHRGIELSGSSAGGRGDQGRDFSPMPQDAEDNLGSETRIARVELSGFGGEGFSRPRSAIDRQQSSKRGGASSGDFHCLTVTDML
jgi:hypothetical protein